MTGKKTIQKTNAITHPVSEEVTKAETTYSEIRTAEEEFGLEISKLIPKAGTIDIKPNQAKILYAPVDEKLVEIRPDGFTYLPWMEYVTRLKEAFKMNWAIVPNGDPKMGTDGKSIMWGFYLVIEGKFAGYAIGEQEYFPGSKAMTWSDACEGAKSNALMRLCKGIGISLELWKPSFINEWKKKYAETYKSTKQKDKWGNFKTLWRKKGEKAEEEPPPTAKPKPEPRQADKELKDKAEKAKKTAKSAPKATDQSAAEIAKEKEEVIKAIDAVLKEKTIDRIRFKEFLFEEQKGKISKKTGEPICYVGINEFGKQSFHCGATPDLITLAKWIADAIEKYIEWETQENLKTEDESEGENGTPF